MTVTAAGVRVEAEIALKNFGVYRTSVTSDVDCRAAFDYGEGAVTIDSSLADRNWSGTIRATGEEVIVAAIGVDAHPIPSVVARFLPLALPFDVGELADYVPVPEDLAPVWRPQTFKSWFRAPAEGETSLDETAATALPAAKDR